MPMKVCVIGAGFSGLITLRYLLDNAEYFDITAYEQAGDIGGTWVYTQRVGTNERGLPIHSSMYRDLRTNLPKEIMACPGFNYQENLPSFITWTEVLQYMHDFAYHYGLKKYIKFDTLVENVSPLKGNGPWPKWKVKTQSLVTSSYHEEEFDAVIVCNGHHKVPFIPDIPGLDTFTGKWLHSHDYRIPEVYKDQVVVCIGAMSSGQDISLGIAKHAKKVYLSTRSNQTLVSLIHEKLQVVGEFMKIQSNTLIAKDQGYDVENVDTIIFCTGYKYSFPFLHPICCPSIIDSRITPLYQHIVHADYPTLYMIGLLDKINITSMFYSQVNFVVRILQDLKLLPSSVEMHREIEAFYKRASKRNIHKALALDKQWEYFDELAEIAGFQKLPPVWNQIFFHVREERYLNFLHFREVNYKVLSDNEFEAV